MTESAPPITLSTSLFGRISLFLAPLLLIGVGLIALPGPTSNALPSAMVVLGIALTISALFFQPWRVNLDKNGIELHSVLRRHLIDWSEVKSIIRTPSRRRVGGLMARTDTGRRRLLTDRAETLYEFERLRESVKVWAPEVSFLAQPPSIPEQ